MAEADLWSYLTTAVSEPNCARCHWETASAPTQIERGWLKSDKVSHTLFSYKWYSLLWAAAVQFHGQWAMVIWLHAYDNQQNPAGFWKYATKNHWFISLIIVKSIFSPVKSPVFSHGIHMFGTKSRHAWDPNQLPGRHGAWHKDIDDIDFYWFLLLIGSQTVQDSRTTDAVSGSLIFHESFWERPNGTGVTRCQQPSYLRCIWAMGPWDLK